MTEGESFWKHGKILVRAPEPLSFNDWRMLRDYIELLKPDGPPCAVYSDGTIPTVEAVRSGYALPRAQTNGSSGMPGSSPDRNRPQTKRGIDFMKTQPQFKTTKQPSRSALKARRTRSKEKCADWMPKMEIANAFRRGLL